MSRTKLLLTILLLTLALPLLAQTPPQESLGDLARQLRQQHDKDAKKATKVFTNDNLPAATPGEAISSPPLPPENPSTTQPTTPNPAAPPASDKSDKIDSKQPGAPEDKAKDREYWQEQFKTARRELAKAKELQQLAEDELNLLQIQQAREMDSNAKADLNARVEAKQSEVSADKAATESAQKKLDDLEKAFQESGAPEDWSQTD